MKSLRIFTPYALVILCALVEWSQSHPTPTLEGDVTESTARNIKGDVNSREVKATIADFNSGHKAAPPSDMLNSADPDRNQNAEKTGEDFKSLAGEDAKINPPGKATQPNTPVKEKIKTFLQKIQSFFLDGPVKVWEKIKQWFSKANFFKHDDKKSTKPEEKLPKRLFELLTPNKWTIAQPAKETPKDSSVNVQKVGQESGETPPAVPKNTFYLKEEEFQPDTLGAQPLPTSNQLDGVKGATDGSPVKSPMHQQQQGTTIDIPSNIKDSQSDPELEEPHTNIGEDLSNIQEANPGNPEQHGSIPSSNPDPKKERPGKMSSQEANPPVVIQEIKEETLPKEVKEKEESASTRQGQEKKAVGIEKMEEKVHSNNKEVEDNNPEPKSSASFFNRLKEPDMVIGPSKVVFLYDGAEEVIRPVEDILKKHNFHLDEEKKYLLEQKTNNPTIIESPLTTCTKGYKKFLEHSERSLLDIIDRYSMYLEIINKALPEKQTTNLTKTKTAVASVADSSLALSNEEVKLLKEGREILQKAVARNLDSIKYLQQGTLEVNKDPSEFHEKTFAQLDSIRKIVDKAFAGYIKFEISNQLE